MGGLLLPLADFFFTGVPFFFFFFTDGELTVACFLDLGEDLVLVTESDLDGREILEPCDFSPSTSSLSESS